MTLTNFPNGISSFGVPTFGAGGLLPFTGNYFWVNESTGSDGNTGGAQDPFATLTQALAKCTANNNDVVFLTGTLHTAATIAWSKSFTHLIGLTAPSANPRARISQTGSSVFTPLVDVTAQGCIFANLATFHGFADASAQICWFDEGQRNFYKNVVFQGMGNATAAAQAGGRSLKVGASGQGENVFEDCIIGLDTVVRNAANASLEFAGATPRNIFRRCVFPCLTSAAGAFFILGTGNGCIDREQLFDDCTFVNQIKSTSTQMTVACSFTTAAPGGMLIMQRCTEIGASKWGDTNALANMFVDGGPPTAGTTGIGIAPQ